MSLQVLGAGSNHSKPTDQQQTSAAITIQSAFRCRVARRTALSLTALGVNTEPKCAVCVENFEERPYKERVKTSCEHIFHKACLKPWVNDRRTCPTCRTPDPLGAPKPRQRIIRPLRDPTPWQREEAVRQSAMRIAKVIVGGVILGAPVAVALGVSVTVVTVTAAAIVLPVAVAVGAPVAKMVAIAAAVGGAVEFLAFAASFWR